MTEPHKREDTLFATNGAGLQQELIDVSIVIPVYNSQFTLRSLVEGIMNVFACMGKRVEIICVDDGSRDGSWDVLCELETELKAWRHGSFVSIQLMRNYGQHNACMCGFRHSRGQIVVTMDDDLQNPPEEIPKLLMGLEEQGLDLVYGTYLWKKHSRWRNLGSFIAHSFYRFVFHCSTDVTSFRGIRRQLLDSILIYNLNFTYIDGLLAWATERIGNVPVAHHSRSAGRSGYSLRKLLGHSLNLFTNFSLLPLQVVSLCGLSVAFIGLLFAMYYLGQTFLFNIEVPGYASTIIAILVLGGTQLLALGVMGEYIGRLHLNVNRKPQYIEREVLSGQPASSGEGLRVSSQGYPQKTAVS